ncbi:arylsulfatase [Halorubrum californiense DSM 19288]|uniref:Arylsulfatase n=1 Tax=Halorubrum californiense DSM 19288 TaxID=1227465 RepID=M0EL76_9EURY|nr:MULTISPECIES: sulfatase-like hydrolase/transferase [Halorubrum]ELZ48501.1 arylsulfatase [Halorubrum californiense DSM 19288]TKX68707.1 arylsulfatase [Halorubrum sp. GN11GM_10-3_MGM]
MARPPNVFLLSADALRADHATELVEAVAERTGGTRFSNAVAPASHTASSIPALATGRFIDEAGAVEESLRPSSLSADGYRTQLLTDNPIAADALTERSAGEAGGLSNLLDDLLPRGVTRPVERAYFRRLWPAMRRLGLADPYYRPAARLHERALEGLSGETDPIFCWLHYMDTHSPYYVPNDGEATEGFDPDRTAAMSRSLTLGDAADVDRTEAETVARLYRRACDHLGGSVVEFVDELRERGLYRADRDVLAVTADHGECLDPERGVFGHLPPASWESLVHVPLVVARPDWPASTVDEQVSLVALPDMLRPDPGTAAPPTDFGREYVETVAGTLTAAGVVRGVRRADGEKLFGRRTADGTDVVHTRYEVGDPAAETVVEEPYGEGEAATGVPEGLLERAADAGGLVGDEQYLSGVDESHLRALGYVE